MISRLRIGDLLWSWKTSLKYSKMDNFHAWTCLIRVPPRPFKIAPHQILLPVAGINSEMQELGSPLQYILPNSARNSRPMSGGGFFKCFCSICTECTMWFVSWNNDFRLKRNGNKFGNLVGGCLWDISDEDAVSPIFRGCSLGNFPCMWSISLL